MTQALASYDSSRSNWLGRYLGVQAELDKKVADALTSAAADTERRLRGLSQWDDDTNMLRVQYNLSLRTIRGYLKELFTDVGDIIRDKRIDAAVAAVEAGIHDDRLILPALFPDKEKRENYVASLKATAKKDVEATIARIFVSEKPLSQRVYKTRALANGQVSRLVNNGLARGDSADAIAKTVVDCIRPDTPGGVGYAAKRLGRTELNNAFHAQSILTNQGKPWVDHIEWRLSKRHKNYPGDPCEEYAILKSFPKDRVPSKPHPNCLCFIIPVLVDYRTFENNLMIGMYDRIAPISA